MMGPAAVHTPPIPTIGGYNLRKSYQKKCIRNLAMWAMYARYIEAPLHHEACTHDATNEYMKAITDAAHSAMSKAGFTGGDFLPKKKHKHSLRPFRRIPAHLSRLHEAIHAVSGRCKETTKAVAMALGIAQNEGNLP